MQFRSTFALASLLTLGCSMVGETSIGPQPSKPNFAPASESPISVGPMPGKPEVGDVNGDGKVDIVVACGTCCGSPPDPQSGHIVVLLGRGDGRFEDAPLSPIKIASSVRKVALADFDRNGTLDIAGAEHDSYEVTLLLGDGKGGFSPAPVGRVAGGEGPRPHTHALSTADVNGDGIADILTTNSDDGTLGVLIGNGRGGFARASTPRIGRHPYDSIATSDFNGDGRIDLAVPDLKGNAVVVLLGDGKAGFAAPITLPVGERPGFVAAGDVNGDRRVDLVSTHDDVGMVDVFLGDGRGGFRAIEGSPFLVDAPVWGVAIVDLNGDGKVDLALGATGRNQREFVVLLGSGTGRFTATNGFQLTSGASPGQVTTADFNGDKKPDLVVSNYDSGDIAVFLAR